MNKILTFLKTQSVMLASSFLAIRDDAESASKELTKLKSEHKDNPELIAALEMYLKPGKRVPKNSNNQYAIQNFLLLEKSVPEIRSLKGKLFCEPLNKIVIFTFLLMLLPEVRIPVLSVLFVGAVMAAYGFYEIDKQNNSKGKK